MSIDPTQTIMTRFPEPLSLPEVRSTATCKTTVEITIKEIEVGDAGDNDLLDFESGFSWCGVKGVLVELVSVAYNLSAETNSDGVVSFKDVPCDNYAIKLSQYEFDIESLDKLKCTVKSGKSSNNDFTIKVRRQLRTVEVFRLPTQYYNAVAGKSNSEDDDPYGHHWLKIYKTLYDAQIENPYDSYGWWPVEPVGKLETVIGVKGALNGYPKFSKIKDHDPYHTKYKRDSKKLQDVFFPYVTDGKTASEYKASIRKYAKSFSKDVSDRWSWRTNGGGWHCKTFQAYLMRKCHIWKTYETGIGDFGWTVDVD